MSQNFAFHDVRTTDLSASRRFYTEMFGWPVIESPAGPLLVDGSRPRADLPPGSVVVIDEPGGATLALWQAAEHQ